MSLFSASTTHRLCNIWNSWLKVLERVIHIFFWHCPHSSARFNTLLTRPILPRGGKSNHVQQLFKPALLPTPRTSARSSLMLFSYLLELAHTIITSSPPFKSKTPLRVFFLKHNSIHHHWLASFCSVRAKDVLALLHLLFGIIFTFPHTNTTTIFKEIHHPDVVLCSIWCQSCLNIIVWLLHFVWYSILEGFLMFLIKHALCQKEMEHVNVEDELKPRNWKVRGKICALTQWDEHKDGVLSI